MFSANNAGKCLGKINFLLHSAQVHTHRYADQQKGRRWAWATHPGRKLSAHSELALRKILQSDFGVFKKAHKSRLKFVLAKLSEFLSSLQILKLLNRYQFELYIN